LRRRIACPRTLWLLDAVIDGSNPQEPVHLHYPGDDLLTPLTRRRGLPIGNLTSQFFANVYLDDLDHFAKEVLRAHYLRYVDDFALFHDDPAVLAVWRERITARLARRRLSLHPRKTYIVSAETPAPSSALSCFPADGAACPRRMSGGSATACAVCATAITRGRLTSTRPCGISAHGLRTPPTPIRGGCAMRSSATQSSTRRGGLTGPLPRRPRRLVKQQSTEPARGEPQRQHAGQPKQQYRLPGCQDIPPLGPASLRRRRVREGVSRTGHDEGPPPGGGGGVRFGRQTATIVCGRFCKKG
jgi:hypothetical protein